MSSPGPQLCVGYGFHIRHHETLLSFTNLSAWGQDSALCLPPLPPPSSSFSLWYPIDSHLDSCFPCGKVMSLCHPQALGAPTLSSLPIREGVELNKAALSEKGKLFWVGFGDFSS